MGDRVGRVGTVRGAGLTGRGRRADQHRPRRSSPAAAPVLAVCAAVAAVTLAADGPAEPGLFLRPRGFFLGPDTAITLPIFDGTFGASARAVAPERLTALALRGPAGGRPIDRASWTAREPRATVRVAVGAPGTYVVGAAIAPPPVGPRGGASSAKTLLAVTDATGHLLAPKVLRTASAATEAIGHDAEIVPLVDPYALAVGDTLPLLALGGGRPLAGIALRAGGTVGTSAAAIPTQTPTTDASGRAAVRLTHDGHWFVAFTAVRETDGAAATRRGRDAVSPAATLTFGLLPAGAR
jgi:hypothetical protein